MGSPAESSLRPLHVAWFAPCRERCGISDYSRHLADALRRLPKIAGVRVVPAPEGIARGGAVSALKHFAADEKRFRDLGRVLNADAGGQAADVAHVQHQYFLFGGVAPHKNHARAFLDAARAPLVMTVHEIALPGAQASGLQRKALERANRHNLLHPAIRRWIVHTAEDRERLESLGAPPERIHLIPVGVPEAEPLPDDAGAKRALGLEGKRIVTLFGFLSVKKGHRVALEAASLLPPDTVVLFAGDRHPDDHTEYVPELKAEIAARGLADRVRITGYLPEERIPQVMAATDIAIAPYLQTSGSASLAHLLAYGRAVVASDIPPHREIAAGSPDCLTLFPSGDASALAEQVRILLGNPDRRPALQAAALSYADRHSFAAAAQATAQVYRLALQA